MFIQYQIINLVIMTLASVHSRMSGIPRNRSSDGNT